MNARVTALLLDVVRRLEAAIVARDCPAIIALDGTRRLFLSDYDYLRDEPTATAFEHRAAVKAREISAERWVVAVPQVWVTLPQEILTRAVSNHPLREGEEEAITWAAFDVQNGADYGRVRYTRRPGGEPVFDEPEIITIGVRPGEHMPGRALLRELLGDEQLGIRDDGGESSWTS